MATKAEMEKLLMEIKPELEAYMDVLRALWPGRDVLCVLHRNDALIKRLKDAIE